MMKHTKESIQNLLMRNDSIGMKAVGRALVVLLDRQTSYEQRAKVTRNHNLRGFSPQDARMGTEQAWFFKNRGYLTERQLAYWRRTDRRGVPRIAKYWRQLLEEAKIKENQKEQDLARSQGTLPLVKD